MCSKVVTEEPKKIAPALCRIGQISVCFTKNKQGNPAIHAPPPTHTHTRQLERQDPPPLVEEPAGLAQPNHARAALRGLRGAGRGLGVGDNEHGHGQDDAEGEAGDDAAGIVWCCMSWVVGGRGMGLSVAVWAYIDRIEQYTSIYMTTPRNKRSADTKTLGRT